MEFLRFSFEDDKNSSQNNEDEVPVFDEKRAKFERLKVGAAIEMAGSEQRFYEQRKNGILTDEKEKEYLSDIDRPVDVIRNGYHGVSEEEGTERAYNAKFNLDVSSGEIDPKHYKRILGFFSGAIADNPTVVSRESAQRFQDPDGVNGGMYRELLEKFPTIMDFDAPANEFLSKLVEANTSEKGDEYKRDMAAFRKMMYGEEQIEAYEAIKALNAEAEDYGISNGDELEERPWKKEWELGDKVGNGEMEFSGRFYGRGEEEDITGPLLEEVYDEVSVDEFDLEPKTGEDLGNGFILELPGGFKDRSEAYAFPRLEGQDVVFYKPTGKYYIAKFRSRR